MHYFHKFCIYQEGGIMPFFPMIDTEQLVKRCKRGDNEALSTLYTTYHEWMLNKCLSIVHDKDVAEDIVHDSFIIIFASISKLNDTQKLRPWMNRIMVNMSLKYLQTKKKEQDCKRDYATEQQEKTISDEYLPIGVLMTMIDNLPEGYRKVFKLSVLEGKTRAEISKELGIAMPTVYSQFYRARMLLAKMVTDYRVKMLFGLLIVTIVPIAYLFLRDTKKLNKIGNYVSKKKEVMPNARQTVANYMSGRHQTEVLAISNARNSVFLYL